ncbi:MAG: cell division protein SepF [Clostridiales bacterium]|nr:cell division protein SepF [Clostridiales bacterium]
MGFKEKFLSWIGIEPVDSEEDGFLPDPQEDPRPSRGAPRNEGQGAPRRQAQGGQYQQPSQAPQQARPQANAISKATVMMHPVSFTDAQIIVDNLNAQRTVIVNVEELSTADAQRVMDFLSGAVYSMDASLKLSSNSVFVLTPPHHLVIHEGEPIEESHSYEY